MLFLIALEMIFERRNSRRENRAQQASDSPETEDFAVFPMAIPMIAGPGSITSVMLLVGRSTGFGTTLVVFFALLLCTSDHVADVAHRSAAHAPACSYPCRPRDAIRHRWHQRLHQSAALSRAARTESFLSCANCVRKPVRLESRSGAQALCRRH